MPETNRDSSNGESSPEPGSVTSRGSESPSRSAKGPQVSIAVSLLLVLISAFFVAGLFYASRVPSVQTDFAVWLGARPPENESGNFAQVMFIMFTFTSPLFIAMTLSLVMSVWNKFVPR